ncbi:alpha/beta hydrolase [Bacteroides rodentium]
MKFYMYAILCLLVMPIGILGNTYYQTKNNEPIIINRQGSFMVGGNISVHQGKYDTKYPIKPDGQTRHSDHAYVFYQIPVDAQSFPIVFLHGAGQSSKTWETTPDGREGFQNMFLRKGFSVYLVDQPRRGKAARSSMDGSVPAEYDEQLWFEQFRLGIWPNFYKGVQFPKGEENLEMFFRQMTPNIGNMDKQVAANAMTSLFEQTGKSILMTHSQGGGIGWQAVMQSPDVCAVISLEPGSSFPFPEGEVPEPIKTNSPFGDLTAESVPVESFVALTKIPIAIYYGDNIPDESTGVWGQDGWTARLKMARLWADCVNKYGGDVTVIHLPDVGIKGNTHFLMSDLNNKQVMCEILKWMKIKKLTNY